MLKIINVLKTHEDFSAVDREIFTRMVEQGIVQTIHDDQGEEIDHRIWEEDIEYLIEMTESTITTFNKETEKDEIKDLELDIKRMKAFKDEYFPKEIDHILVS
jgi:hypothetical protein